MQLINAGNTSAGPAELSTNRAKWDAASMGGNYDFTLTIQQFSRDGGRPISISVRDGQVTKAVYQDTGEAAPDYRKLSIEDMFSQAKDAYDTGAERVTTQYDPTTGALSSLYIDRSAMIADEEIGYSVSNITLPKAG